VGGVNPARGRLAAVAGLAAGRLAQAALVALVVGVASFAMLEALGGDAAYRVAAMRYGYDIMDSASAELVRAELGLDRPAPARLGDWLWALARFELGDSHVTGAPVTQELAHQLGASLTLAGAATALSLLIALPVGVAAGLRPGGAVDRLSLAASLLLRATPAFALAVVLILALAVRARLLPVAGYGGPVHLVLPALTLALGLAAVSSRVVRDAVAEAMASDWRRFARVKGLTARATFLRHVVRNAAAPVVAYVGVQTAYLIEGVVIVESVFAFPGLGHALVHAIFGRDVAMLQGAALTLGLLYVGLNLIVDLLGRAIDPRGMETAR